MIAADSALTARAVAGCSRRVCLVLVLLSLARAAVIELPHDLDYTTPRSAPLLQSANCSALFLNVNMEHPGNASPRAESRRVLSAKLMRNSKSNEEELEIGRMLLGTITISPQLSASDNQTIFDFEVAAKMIGRVDIIFCYRLAETPVNSSLQATGDDFCCLHELQDSHRFTLYPHGLHVMVSADLLLPLSVMNIKRRALYEYHVFAESAEGCSAVSPAAYFQLDEDEPPAVQPAVPEETSAAKFIREDGSKDAALPVFSIHYPQHGSVILSDIVRSIVSFNETDILLGTAQAPNPAGFLLLSGIREEDALYTVVLNQRLLKSFHAKNVVFESGGSPSIFYNAHSNLNANRPIASAPPLFDPAAVQLLTSLQVCCAMK
jgi:hypothetical protein